jgi:hypothetical protein
MCLYSVHLTAHAVEGPSIFFCTNLDDPMLVPDNRSPLAADLVEPSKKKKESRLRQMTNNSTYYRPYHQGASSH